MMTGDEFSQPIHQVLSDYALLEVAQCEDVHFSLDQPLSWRMNLCAISQLYPTKYFIAVNSKICVYGISSSLVFTPQPIMVLKPSTNREFMINAIKLGPMKLSPNTTTMDEILIAVGDNGEIFAWNTQTLFTTTTTTTSNHAPFLHRYNVDATSGNNDDNDDASTWGIAMHRDGLIAVSANNHRITIYNLWASTPQLQQHKQNRLGQRSQVVLAGHTHNIPCIDFDSSGRYLASGSVDRTCRLWDLSTLQQVGQRFMTRSQDSDAWLWGVKFIPTGQFKSATCHHAMLAKRLQRHIHQGRATNTTDLHMEHSARAPIYQLDMHQMFHRLRTGDVTDDDDDDDVEEDPATMSQLIRLRRLISQRLGHAAHLDEQGEDAIITTPPPPLQQQQQDDDAADAGLLDWENEAMLGGVQDGSWHSYSDDDDDDDDEMPVWRQDDNNNDLDDDDDRVDLDDDDGDDDDYASAIEDESFSGHNLDDFSGDNGTLDDEWNDPPDDDDSGDDTSASGRATTHLWNTNQREDYDDLLAEEEGWMQDRAQFPWHWLGVRSGGGDQDQQVTSLLQDDDTTDKVMEAAAAALEPKVLAPTTTTTTHPDGNIPYVFEPTTNVPTTTTPMDYLMLTSKKDAYLLHPTPMSNDDGWTMPTVQRERGVVSRADARTAFVLDMMERLSFVEWIPDLELCVVASQKGCVALMRVLQVQWPQHHHGQQSCLFNHETYLPLHGLQNSVLYGMTIHRLPSESTTATTAAVYQLLLLYLDGTMRSYRLSKPTAQHSSLVDLVSVL